MPLGILARPEAGQRTAAEPGHPAPTGTRVRRRTGPGSPLGSSAGTWLLPDLTQVGRGDVAGIGRSVIRALATESSRSRRFCDDNVAACGLALRSNYI